MNIVSTKNIPSEQQACMNMFLVHEKFSTMILRTSFGLGIIISMQKVDICRKSRNLLGRPKRLPELGSSPKV